MNNLSLEEKKTILDRHYLDAPKKIQGTWINGVIDDVTSVATAKEKARILEILEENCYQTDDEKNFIIHLTETPNILLGR